MNRDADDALFYIHKKYIPLMHQSVVFCDSSIVDFPTEKTEGLSLLIDSTIINPFLIGPAPSVLM